MGVVEEVLRLKDEASAAIRKVGAESGKTNQEVGKLRTALGHGAVGLAGAFAAVAGAAVAMQAETERNRRELTSLSQRTGVATETLRGLQVAFEQAGLEAGLLDSAVENLPERMVQAAQGGNEVSETFKAIGVSVTDATGKMRSSDAVLRETVRALGQVPSEAQAAGYGMQLLSDAGAALSIVAREDADALDKMIERARVFGADYGPEAAAGTRDLTAAMSDLEMVLTGLVDGLLGDFLGHGLPQMIDNLSTGIVAVGGFLSGFLSSLFDDFNEWLDDLGVKLAHFIDAAKLATEGDYAGAGQSLATSGVFDSMPGMPGEDVPFMLGAGAGPNADNPVAQAVAVGLAQAQQRSDLFVGGMSRGGPVGGASGGGDAPQGDDALTLLGLPDTGTFRSAVAGLTEVMDEWRASEALAAQQAAWSMRDSYASAFSSILSAAQSFAQGSLAAHKALGIANVAVSTSIGIMKAIETYGPTPVGYAAAVAVAAQGAAEAAAILSTGLGSGPRSSGLRSGGISGSLNAADSAAVSASAFQPASQAGNNRPEDGGGGGGLGRRGAIRVETVGGLANVRELVEAINEYMGPSGYGLALDGRG